MEFLNENRFEDGLQHVLDDGQRLAVWKSDPAGVHELASVAGSQF